MQPITGNEPPDALKATQEPTSAQTILSTVDKSLTVGQSTILQISTTNPDGSKTIDTVPLVKTDEPSVPTPQPPPEE